MYKLIQNKHGEWEAGKLPSVPPRPRSGALRTTHISQLAPPFDRSAFCRSRAVLCCLCAYERDFCVYVRAHTQKPFPVLAGVRVFIHSESAEECRATAQQQRWLRREEQRGAAGDGAQARPVEGKVRLGATRARQRTGCVRGPTAGSAAFHALQPQPRQPGSGYCELHNNRPISY